MESPITSEGIVRTLDIFYRAVRVPLSLVSPAYETVFCLPSFEYQFWPPDLIRLQAEVMSSKALPDHYPYIVSDAFDIHTGMFRLPNDYFLVIGPVCSHVLTEEDQDRISSSYSGALPSEYDAAFLNAYRTSLPADIIRFANILALLANLIDHSQLDPIDIILKNFPEKQPEDLEEDPEEPAFPADHSASPDEIILFENMLTEAVRTGNAAYLEQTLRTIHPLFQQASAHYDGKKPYAALTLLVLMRFAALHGGADSTKTHQTYDRALTGLERAASTGDHISLVIRTAGQFCQLVSDNRFDRPYKEACKKLEHYVSHHLGERITLKDLSAACHLSERQISRIFEEGFRMKMPDYIHKERVSRAMTLLTSSHYSINEIAVRLGYASQSHFSVAFKKYTGFTPGTFRKKPERIR